MVRGAGAGSRGLVPQGLGSPELPPSLLVLLQGVSRHRAFGGKFCQKQKTPNSSFIPAKSNVKVVGGVSRVFKRQERQEEPAKYMRAHQNENHSS